MFMGIREKYELLIASVSLMKENDMQTEKTEFAVAQRHVPAGEPGYAAVTNNAKKISGWNNKGLILTHVKSFVGSVNSLGSCSLYVGSTCQVTLVLWHCDTDVCFHAGDGRHGDFHMTQMFPHGSDTSLHFLSHFTGQSKSQGPLLWGSQKGRSSWACRRRGA